MGKWHKHKKTSHTKEPRGQPFPSRMLQGCKEHTIKYYRQTCNTKTHESTKSTALERSVKILEGSIMFDGTNQALISDMDQDKQMLVCMQPPSLIDVSTYKNGYKTNIKT